jgi:excinuclease UvrABC ATPase subunit
MSIISKACPGYLIEQNHFAQPRSTAGTITEIYDYLRLYARAGTPRPEHHVSLEAQPSARWLIMCCRKLRSALDAWPRS